MLNVTFQSPKATVLFIASPRNIFSFSMQEIGIRRNLMRSRVNIDVEFFEPDQFDRELRFVFMQRHIESLLQRKKYDLVISSGPEACAFLEENYSTFFNGIPAVFFFSGNDAHLKELAEKDNFYVFLEENFLGETIDAARKICPDAVNYVALRDNSKASIEDLKIFRQKAEQFDDKIKFSEINAALLSRRQLWNELASLDDDSVIFYLGVSSDAQGHPYSMTEKADLIVGSATKIPIFTHTINGMGYGIVGGKMTDFQKAGEKVGKTIMEILNDGSKPKKLQRFSDGKFLFGYLALRRCGVKLSRLPKNTLILNMPDGIRKYKIGIFVGVIGIFSSLLFFIVLSWFFFISEIKQARNLRRSNLKIRHLAEHDYLTNLPNRMKFTNAFDSIKKKKKPFSVVMFDIDNFKNVNDIYTHAIGDEVLRTVSQRLLLLSRKGNFFVSRFDGDEFLALYSDTYLEEDSPEMKSLKEIFASPVILDDIEIPIQASFGVVNAKDESLEIAITNVDIALHRAKECGNGKTVFFSDEMKLQFEEAYNILTVLDNAILNDGIGVVYQPQINSNTGEIYGYEALMRLTDAKISPAKFIPIAEESGRIIKIARILTEKVFKQMDEWRAQGIPLRKVSINYSYGQISDDSYIDFLSGLMKKYDIPPELVCIEITESLFVSNKHTVTKFLDEIVQKGIMIALDDFGTGYSSLSYLTFLPIDIVKIDKSLVDNYLSGDKEAFVENLVQLIHSLNMKLVVEGVEHEWQNEKLHNFHCDYIQGYYYSKPISGPEVEEFNKKFPRQ
ncbi:MAG: bifunctional diguanylate cyclase/phosphodiesterase [Treponemataceae bacterium]|nr:bifunctional diguanylate cyclase/phosphodiesterase [Treponemataceae bacterium]